MAARVDPLGVVLAGGRGTRMGRPKAAVVLRGRPLLEYPLAALAGAGLEAVVVAKRRTALPALEAEVWQEEGQRSHPLSGIVHALARAEGRPLVVVACDMPFLSAGLLRTLASTATPLLVPAHGGRLHPLAARYETCLLAPLTRALAEERSLHETIRGLQPRLLAGDELSRLGDPDRLLLNVNDSADLERAEQLLGG